MQRRIPWRRLDGVLLLDKAPGVSSNGALQAARRLFLAEKGGHTGTLDPMATGLLPLAFGEATKFSGMLLGADKAYEATVRLGIETDTGDAEGAPIAHARVSSDRQEIEAVLARFTGPIEQIPPMFSALKRDGRPLYEYARAGMEVEREVRQVCIHKLELLGVEGDSFRIRVRCSKGTYIRVLAVDLGRALGCGAHLSALRRTGTGGFDVAQAYSLAALEAMSAQQRECALLPADALVSHLPVLNLAAAQAAAVLQGQALRVPGAGSGLMRMYDTGGRFLGLGELDPAGKLSPKRLIATGATISLPSSD